MKRLIKAAITTAASVIMLGISAPSQAQTYPDRSIRIIVPYAPGGPADFITRLIGDRLSTRLGQQVVVENKPGASGATAIQLALSKPADGYTLVLGHEGNLAANLVMLPNLAYDPVKDLVPITLVAEAPDILLVNPKLPIKSIPDALKYAKEQPSGVNWATAGVGSGGHFAYERLKRLSGLNAVHVPYDGGAPAALAVVSGQAQLTVQSPAASSQYIESGQLVPLAVTSAERSPLLPNVPTLKEAGYDFDQLSWYGLLARAGTPNEIIGKLNSEVVSILKEPEVIKAAADRRLRVTPSSQEAFATYLQKEIPKMAAVVKEAGLAVK